MEIQEFYLSALAELYGFSGRHSEEFIIEIVIDGEIRPATQVEIDAIIETATELKAVYDGDEYIRLRKSEMPSAEDQLELMFNDEMNGMKTWRDFIKEIQDKYPKP